jgi:hypothetical protein
LFQPKRFFFSRGKSGVPTWRLSRNAKCSQESEECLLFLQTPNYKWSWNFFCRHYFFFHFVQDPWYFLELASNITAQRIRLERKGSRKIDRNWFFNH